MIKRVYLNRQQMKFLPELREALREMARADGYDDVELVLYEEIPEEK